MLHASLVNVFALKLRVAQALNIPVHAIARLEVWFNNLFLVIKHRRPRFASKLAAQPRLPKPDHTEYWLHRPNQSKARVSVSSVANDEHGAEYALRQGGRAIAVVESFKSTLCPERPERLWRGFDAAAEMIPKVELEQWDFEPISLELAASGPLLKQQALRGKW